MNHTLLDPRNDLVFKMLFANSLPLLTDLINAVRGNEPPIIVVSVQNPRIDAEEWQGKFIILDILITYFAHWKEENIMNQIAYPPVLEALQQLKALSADDEARRLAEVRERAMMSERTEIEAALARGEDIGEARGKEMGAAQAKAEALRCLIESGIPEAQARTILHM